MSNTRHTEIAFVLDKSGSMSLLCEAAISGFNHFIHAQRELPIPARLTLALFDHRYQVVHETVPLEKIPQLTNRTYHPNGNTALLDAIGRTITDTDNFINKLPEEERPGKVIIAIFTDGYENSSRHYNFQQVSDLIQTFREQKEWEFLFLAANQDAFVTASKLSINPHDSGNVTFTSTGWAASNLALNRKVRAIRKNAAKMQLDEQEHKDLNFMLDHLVKEEESKQFPKE